MHAQMSSRAYGTVDKGVNCIQWHTQSVWVQYPVKTEENFQEITKNVNNVHNTSFQKYRQRMFIFNRNHPWPSLATSPYYSSPLAGLQGYIPCPHIAAVCKFELVVPPSLGHIWGSIGVHHLTIWHKRLSSLSRRSGNMVSSLSLHTC